MSYLANTPEDVACMLRAVGVSELAALFADIPKEILCTTWLDLPPALSELELTDRLSQLAGDNVSVGQKICFLGGGSYDHFIPAVVELLASRSEFLTSYTPYQPEASQGNLQAMFEYQTLICQLTGLDVSNASLYDGGSATAEAVLMALSVLPARKKVVVSQTVHPEYRQILATYLANQEVEILTLPAENGATSLQKLEEVSDDQVACVVIQHPNFFGVLEDVAAAAQIAHREGALLIEVFDPISLGMLKGPAELGADIAVAEGQALGIPLGFGGPYLGILACREPFLRRLPGRLVGQTQDRDGRRCFVLTLQTREQHIRRANATSNVCTNHALLALRASIYLALLGPQGLAEVARLCWNKAHYAAQRITADGRLKLAFDRPFFKEFAVRDGQGQVKSLLAHAEREGFFAGLPLGRWYPELDDCFSVAVTERRSREQIDALADCLSHA
ncbi:MAG: aminomethyl-transferring glycine dehydrogenase subunit GcvPA [Methylohalobius sp.]|nr:aminomethyl-transferring glycine dehydrogenase subunit GcvPA [Methylohalobius sp.]